MRHSRFLSGEVVGQASLVVKHDLSHKPQSHQDFFCKSTKRVNGVAWLPLVLLLLERSMNRGGLRSATWAGAALALVLLGSHPQFTFYAGLLIVPWTLPSALDVIRNKGYNSRMMTYATLQSDRREFLALTGLTLQEFQLLLNAFTPAYERRYPKDRTLADRPRQRCAGGGRKGVLDCPEQKLLFLLVYLKTYPLQVLMGELFGLSQPGVNYWIHRLLPVLRDALDSLSVLPERNPNDFARSQTATGTEPRLIIDGTERRRQRPKSPEKQALHYSGKKKAHTDKNVVIVDLRRKCIGFLSRTYVGKTHDKKIADSEGISYPPKAELYKDTGFQGYEPAVTRTCQAKKKAARRGTHSR